MNQKLDKTKLRIYFHSHDVGSLNSLLTSIAKTALELNVKISIVSLPTKRKLFSLLSSPTVYKSSRDQYEFVMHTRMVEIKKITQEGSKLFERTLIPSSIKMSMRYV